MTKTHIKIKTWICKACGYKQDCEPTQENANTHFNLSSKYVGNSVLAGDCPSCRQKGKVNPLTRATKSEDKIGITVMGEEEIDLLETIDEKNPKLPNGSVGKRKLKAPEKAKLKKQRLADLTKFKALED